MTSKPSEYSEAYVWVWLPNATEPVVAGRLHAGDESFSHYAFDYGNSYLERSDATPLYLPELPLERGELPPPPTLNMPGCIRDAAPDAWGRRVILNRHFGRGSDEHDPADLSELTYLLESGSDRIGALDFQRSPTEYEPRSPTGATLDELIESAHRVEEGIPLSPQLDRALYHGSSIGGARPKAIIVEENRRHIAKFPLSSDLYNVVKGEFIAMRLASLCGLNVAPVSLVSAAEKDVLLVERFDRVKAENENGWQRKTMISALTILGLNEMMARYASYTDLAEHIRLRFTDAPATLKELFARLVFNILCGNTDDHARNHSAFWDGEHLTLTPAYDVCPQSRTGQEASQAMRIADNNLSRIATCLEAAHHFLLSAQDAIEIVEKQLRRIGENWHSVCDDAKFAVVDRNRFWGRQFLNPYAFTDLQGAAAPLAKLADEIRAAPRRGSSIDLW